MVPYKLMTKSFKEAGVVGKLRDYYVCLASRKRSRQTICGKTLFRSCLATFTIEQYKIIFCCAFHN